MNPIYSRRRRKDIVIRGLCIAAAAFGVTWLALILITLLYNGLTGLTLQVFTETSVIRFINDILLSAPSIIIGLFIYGAVVVPMRGFSAIAGALALAVIVIPVVLRTTEDMLLLVPNPLREAASALGLPRSLVIKRIAYRAARSGLITGVLLATARVAGETAPLLFTALSNQFFSLSLTKTMANLPVTINNFVQSPYAYWKQLAWSGALLITLTVLALNIGARILGAERTAK